MMLKYIGNQAKSEIRNALDKAMKIKPEVYFKLYDTECYLGTFMSADTVLSEMDGGDEQFIIELTEDGRTLGKLYIIMEECDVIYDYTANEFCEEIMKC